jgi:HAAS domain-containing protein
VNSTTDLDEIGTYMAGVRAALTGLPEATRAELLEDLPEHLAEVLAEGTGTLVERLGTPEAYANELRATAGFVGGFPDPPPSQWASGKEVRENFKEMLANTLGQLRRADVKVGPLIGYPKVSDFLLLLRPAWWVLRGYLAAMVLAFWLNADSADMGLLPRVGGSDIVALVLLAGAVVGSILLGKRAAPRTAFGRWALWSGTTVLVLFAWSGFLTADSNSRHPGYNDVGSYDTNPYSNVQDVYVYDSQSNLVQNARLYDQDGSPIQLGSTDCTDPDTGEWRESHTIGYPRCPENAPFVVPAPSGAAVPSSSASPSAGPSAGSSAGPSARASSAGPPAAPARPSSSPSTGR